MSWIRALVCALPGVLQCITSHHCPEKIGDKPLQVFTLWLCSSWFLLLLFWCSHSLHVFHTHCCSCCNEHFADWAPKSAWWWAKGRYWKILSLLLSWGCGPEVTARDYSILPFLLCSWWFLGTPQSVLPDFLTISNVFDPVIPCTALGRLIFSCLLTKSQVSQAGAGFSDSRLQAGAWQ